MTTCFYPPTVPRTLASHGKAIVVVVVFCLFVCFALFCCCCFFNTELFPSAGRQVPTTSKIRSLGVPCS